MMAEDWDSHESRKEIEIMHKYARRGNFITNFYAGELRRDSTMPVE